MKALIGRKIGMSNIFGKNGKLVPVTLVQAGPCVITAVKTKEKDGYDAIQIGFEQDKRPIRAKQGQFKGMAAPRYVREIRFKKPPTGQLRVGDSFDVGSFAEDELVSVTGISKGKGFAGTIKRHNFKRGPKTHGSKSYRAPGSIGSMYPQKIFKGKKMAGHMGQDRVTLRKVPVSSLLSEDNVIALKGPVPGPRRSLVIIKGN